MKNITAFILLAVSSSSILMTSGCITVDSSGNTIKEVNTSETVNDVQVITTDDLSRYRWKLYSVYGERYILPNMPYLEFDDRGVFGFAGCNQFSGKYSLNTPNIEIGPLMSTKMACSELQIETTILKALSDSKYIYIQENGRDALKLFNAEKSVTLILQGIEKPVVEAFKKAVDEDLPPL